MFLANENISAIDGTLFSVIAMVIVFLVLAILVICVGILSQLKYNEAKKGQDQPVAAPTPVAAPQKAFTMNDITDEDMMVAALVATADFIEETKETDVRVKSVKQIG